MTFTTVAQIESAETKDLIVFYNSINTEKPVKKFADRQTAIKRCSALIISDSEVEEESAEVEGEKKFVWPFQMTFGSVERKLAIAAGKPAPKKADKPTVTKAQAAILRRIALGDFTTVNGTEPKALEEVGPVWTCTTLETAAEQRTFEAMEAAGLVVGNGAAGEDSCVSLTQAGFDAYKALPAGYGVAAVKPKKAISHASNAAGVAASWGQADVAAARLTRDGVSVTVNDKTTTHKSARDAFRHYRLLDSKHIRFRGVLKAAKSAVYEENGVSYLFKII